MNVNSESKTTWNFPKAFWSANIVELFERAAYYALFIAITLYLTNVVGFNDIWSAWISGIFSAGIYFLPPFFPVHTRICLDSDGPLYSRSV